MPTSFLSADAGFPRLTADVPVEERMRRITDYLYMLLENLRYTLGNLGEENFNEASLKKIEDSISDPIYRQLTDLEGNVTTLQATADGLYAEMYDPGGKVTTLEATAAGLHADMYDPGGKVTTLEATAAGLHADMYDAGGKVTTLEATADGLYADMYNANGRVASISATADKISWIVASGTSSSDMTMTSDAISVISEGIGLTGTVTFNTLESEDGTTVIDGNNVELWANDYGDSISKIIYRKEGVVEPYNNVMGRIYTIDNHTQSQGDRANYAFVIETPSMVDSDYCALKLVAGDSMSLESRYLIYMGASRQIILNGRYEPTEIVANVSYADATGTQQSNAYYFCSDGIYYGSTKIVSV